MGLSEVSDVVLWERSLAGDSAAFAALFDRHRDRVFAHARRLLELPADGEDVTAIAFLELWRRRTDVRIVNDSVLPWLLVTTTNTARNTARGHRRYGRFLATLPPPGEEPDVHDGIAERVDGEAQRRVLRRAIRHLSLIDRNLLVLTEFEEFTLREASEVLNITYGAAKTRMSRVRGRLRAALPGNPRLSSEEGIVL